MPIHYKDRYKQLKLSPGGDCVIWQTPSMPGPAFEYYPTKKDALHAIQLMKDAKWCELRDFHETLLKLV